MDIKQGIELAALAKIKGYCVAVRRGKVQFQTVEYNESGVSEVTPHTRWLGYAEAMEILAD